MSFRLTPIDKYNFMQWAQRSGFTDELHFWSYLSGLPSGSVYDHMVSYLTSLGYTGGADDKLRQFILDQVGWVGTTFDNANRMFQGTFSTGETGSGLSITTEGGDTLVTEDGDPIVTE